MKNKFIIGIILGIIIIISSIFFLDFIFPKKSSYCHEYNCYPANAVFYDINKYPEAVVEIDLDKAIKERIPFEYKNECNLGGSWLEIDHKRFERIAEGKTVYCCREYTRNDPEERMSEDADDKQEDINWEIRYAEDVSCWWFNPYDIDMDDIYEKYDKRTLTYPRDVWSDISYECSVEHDGLQFKTTYTIGVGVLYDIICKCLE